MMGENERLIVLVGPTAVGKTRVSLSLARQFNGEIVSADSRLVYRRMDIGTAKPSQQDRRRVPHHLIDVADPNEAFSMATFRKMALAAIYDCHQRAVLPFLVGGTGQFVRALVEGWQPPRARDRGFRQEMEALAEREGHQALHHRLQQIDPDRARAIDSRNVRRVARALEIHHVTGERPSEIRHKQPPDFAVLMLGLRLPRSELYERIDQRLKQMLADGWLEEVKGLLERGVSPEAPSMTAIGYRELAAVVAGDLSLQQAESAIKRTSREFVRKQANWFRDDDDSIHWFAADDRPVEQMSDLIRRWLVERN